MKSFMKIILYFILPALVILVVGAFFYLKSGTYDNKKASALRDSKIEELNSIKRLYIPEGVYSYRYNRVDFKKVKDKFGNQKTERVNRGSVDYEVSFSSDKLVILNEEANITEELMFKKPCVITAASEDLFAYGFYVESWKIINTSTNEVVDDILTKIWRENPDTREEQIMTVLSLGRDKTPWFQSYFGYRIPNYDGAYIRDYSNPLSYYGEAITILSLGEMNYSYNDVFGPEYVSTARYEDHVYDIENYKKN